MTPVNRNTNFPAKILLFGEYALVLGSSGLAIPFPHYSGHFSMPEPNNEQAKESNRSIKELLIHLIDQSNSYKFLNLNQLSNEIEKNLWFNSNIPLGSGLGSSGALVAAIYDRYLTINHKDIPELKFRLAQIESHFHGQSSGVDPLAAYLQKPIHLASDKQINILNEDALSQIKPEIFLIDTQISSKTASLVPWFMNQMETNLIFKNQIENQYIKLNHSLIEQIVTTKTIINHEKLKQLSEFQLNYFQPMIPESFKMHFKNGIKDQKFTLKLCGSGGGGLMLGFTQNKEQTETYFKKHQLKTLFIQQESNNIPFN